MKYFALFALIAGMQFTYAAVCDPNDFQGAYGFSLTGDTTIGGPVRPVAVVGRLVLDGSGTVSGISSVAFTGLVLGNPVSGNYEAHFDCSVTWSLQDDSGNWQHFAGTMSGSGARVTFRQTDPGGAQNGILLRTAGDCAETSLRGPFNLSLSGATVDVDSGIASRSVSLTGLLEADGAGGLSFARRPDAPLRTAGSYQFQDGCFVHFTITLAASNDDQAEMHFRGILVDNSRTVLGIQTDPGTVVNLRLVPR